MPRWPTRRVLPQGSDNQLETEHCAVGETPVNATSDVRSRGCGRNLVGAPAGRLHYFTDSRRVGAKGCGAREVHCSLHMRRSWARERPGRSSTEVRPKRSYSEARLTLALVINRVRHPGDRPRPPELRIEGRGRAMSEILALAEKRLHARPMDESEAQAALEWVAAREGKTYGQLIDELRAWKTSEPSDSCADAVGQTGRRSSRRWVRPSVNARSQPGSQPAQHAKTPRHVLGSAEDEGPPMLEANDGACRL